MKTFRSPLVLAATAILMIPSTGITQGEKSPTSDFDFWQGDWTVTVQAALPDGSWQSAEGISSAFEAAGGHAHMETVDTGQYESRGIRAFDVATGKWNYTMFDNLQMKGLKVWSGNFTDGVGTFEAKLPLPTGVTADTRIVIDEIQEDSFKWRFEMSMDGQQWQTVMKMDFRRNS